MLYFETIINRYDLKKLQIRSDLWKINMGIDLISFAKDEVKQMDESFSTETFVIIDPNKTIRELIEMTLKKAFKYIDPDTYNDIKNNIISIYELRVSGNRCSTTKFDSSIRSFDEFCINATKNGDPRHVISINDRYSINILMYRHPDFNYNASQIGLKL